MTKPDPQATLLDSRGYPRPPQNQPGANAGRVPANRGMLLPRTLISSEEIHSLIDACSADEYGARTRALVAILYRTGVNITEALGLAREDLDLSEGRESVWVAAIERYTPRRLALDNWVLVHLQPWIEIRATLPGEAFLCVIAGPTCGRAWDYRDARANLQALAEASIGRHVRMRDFRHTLVAELLIEQWPLPFIQTQLGIRGWQRFGEIFEDLGIRQPEDAEVMEITRSRPPLTHPGEALP